MGVTSDNSYTRTGSSLDGTPQGHPGLVRMKVLARMWSGITLDIEKPVRECFQCQQTQSTPPPAPLRLWSWPSRSWACLHLDYAGSVDGKMILILIDAHSKWIVSYRIKPQSTTRVSPAELLHGRRPRTRLDLIKPHTAERVEDKQQQQKMPHPSLVCL